MAEMFCMSWIKNLATRFVLVSLALAVFGIQAQARTYKGDLSSGTLVFEVTTSVDGDGKRVEIWFAQWVGNVYAKSIETSVDRIGPRGSGRPVCETASWIAPQRHIWREGDDPYLTKTQELKFLRLDHSIKKRGCERVKDETRRVSKGALKRAQAWFTSRQISSKTIARDHRDIGNVETWMAKNIPGFVSVKVRNQTNSLDQTRWAQSEK